MNKCPEIIGHLRTSLNFNGPHNEMVSVEEAYTSDEADESYWVVERCEGETRWRVWTYENLPNQPMIFNSLIEAIAYAEITQ